jgi:hypothetical protein
MMLSSFINLKWLWIGSDEARINQDSYNRFTGSLAPLQSLTKLEWLEINNTNLIGLEYLPESLNELYCTGELAQILAPYKHRDGYYEFSR